jgi:hypothetical protein
MKTCKQRRISTVVKNILLFFVASNGDTQDTHELQSRGAQISGASTFRRLNFYSVAPSVYDPYHGTCFMSTLYNVEC